MKTRMMNSHPLWKWLPVLALCSTAALAEETLQQQLEARKAEFAAKVPQEVQTAYAAGIQAVSDSGILSSAKQAGDKAPDFTLQDAKGQSVALHEL